MKNKTGASALATLILALISLTPFSVSAQAGSSYSTNFAAAEDPISEGGKWVNGKAVGLGWNNVQTVPGKAYGAHIIDGPRYADCIAHLNTAFTADQYAQGTVSRVPGYKNPSDKHEIELLLRFKITANSARGYEVLWGQDGEIYIVRWNGPLGDYTSLAGIPNSGPGEAVDGDVLRAEIAGSVIKVYKNGSLVLTGPSNSTWTDGQPGMGFWPMPGATLSSYGWKNYQAGIIGSGTSLDSSVATFGSTFCDDPQPNPSNPSTLIRYGLSRPGNVSMTLHNASGGRVATLVKGYRKSGHYHVTLSANEFSSGVYFVSVKIGAFNKTVKVLLLK